MEVDDMADEQTTQKKGLSPLAWIGIGCGAIILIAFLVMSVGIWFGARKVKDIAKDFEDDPARTAAEMIVRMNPELELMETDTSEGTITIRDKESGEVATFDYSEIKEGKLSFESSEGKIAFDATGENEGALLTVETDDGTSQWVAGGEPDALPDWLPDYPEAEAIQTAYSERKKDSHSGTFSFITVDSAEDVLAFYRAEFESSGLSFEETTTTTDGVIKGGSITAKDDDRQRQATVTITPEDEKTRVGVFFSDGV
jgi:hypothetical protein